MLRIIPQSTTASLCLKKIQPRPFSTKSAQSLLEADSGAYATRIHHVMTTILAGATPVVLFTPDKYTDGLPNKIFGLILAVNVAGHSWIGLNYVATDYVPKISKSFIRPARIFSAGLGVVTLLGLSKIALNDQGGIKAVMKGLWTPKDKQEK